uniref:E3 ubiquitin-protein ligase TRIM32-like n=1 Tax=Scleropages formosus TaxID=113540 RepID=A0A8C9VDV3_SCLFO
MSVGSHVSSTAPHQEHTHPSVPGSTAEHAETELLEEPERKHSPEPLPSWASEAFGRLTQGERELCRVRERQAREIEEVNQGLERTILGVQTEERLLLERVQQDHRDAQRHLEQLQRENAAAARVSQSLVDQRLYRLAQLKKDLKEWSGVHCASHQNQLLKCVSELLQPWEITLSLRRVSFRPKLPFSNVSRKEQMGEGDRQFREKAESTSFGDEGVPSPLDVGRLVRQFGKQGSGRSDFTLPSGLHATPQGHLFVVDCGNARVQVTDARGNIVQQMSSGGFESSGRRCRNYFDIAVSAKGLIALSCAAQRALLIFNRHGRQLQMFGGTGMGGVVELDAPRGVAINYLDEFLVADVRRGSLTALKLDAKTGSKLECTTVSSFHRPYLVAACLTTRLVAVSERGNEVGRAPCIKVLDPDYSVVRILGECLSVGPLLSRPWGICIDRDGDILVADWGKDHRVVIYPAQGVGCPLVTQGLSSPRGLTLLPQGQLVVSDSMHHCIKIFKYK